MKQRKSILTGCLCTVALTFFLIYRLGVLVRPIDTDIALSAINSFHKLPKNSIEVIAYGSSHVWRGFVPMELYNQYGIGAYNYGCNWQHINTTKLFIEDSLRTQSPKVILIETFYINELQQNVNMDGEIYYTRAIPISKEKIEYLKQCFGFDPERWLSYYIPLSAFHDNWVNLEKGSFGKSSDSTDFFASKGFVYTAGSIPIELSDPELFKNKELDPAAVEILDDITDLCKRKNIKIILYTAPMEGEFCYEDAIQKYADKHDCVYLNLFKHIEDIGIDCETDFCDADHLNYNGAVKVSDYLGRYIYENYNVSDMRAVTGNIWSGE